MRAPVAAVGAAVRLDVVCVTVCEFWSCVVSSLGPPVSCVCNVQLGRFH